MFKKAAVNANQNPILNPFRLCPDIGNVKLEFGVYQLEFADFQLEFGNVELVFADFQLEFGNVKLVYGISQLGRADVRLVFGEFRLVFGISQLERTISNLNKYICPEKKPVYIWLPKKICRILHFYFSGTVFNIWKLKEFIQNFYCGEPDILMSVNTF